MRVRLVSPVLNIATVDNVATVDIIAPSLRIAFAHELFFLFRLCGRASVRYFDYRAGDGCRSCRWVIMQLKVIFRCEKLVWVSVLVIFWNCGLSFALHSISLWHFLKVTFFPLETARACHSIQCYFAKFSVLFWVYNARMILRWDVFQHVLLVYQAHKRVYPVVLLLGSARVQLHYVSWAKTDLKPIGPEWTTFVLHCMCKLETWHVISDPRHLLDLPDALRLQSFACWSCENALLHVQFVPLVFLLRPRLEIKVFRCATRNSSQEPGL